jgi:Carboxypeptidase regulatory-like domain/Gram-negative bacterial TonB protein C-terminal
VPLSMVWLLTPPVQAEPITGQVLDRKSGAPLEGAVVHVAGPDGFEQTLAAGAEGRYAVDVAPGRYAITFLHGQSRVTGHVVVQPGLATKLDGRVVSTVDEIIVLEDARLPAVLPLPKDPKVATRAPPYSDQAIEQDAWTRAWMLLDVDETGTVTQVKFLKRPGYDLDDIALSEVFKLSFSPGRNERNQPVRTLILWPIEWVANSWLLQIGTGMRTRMPATRGLSGVSTAAYVPCKGSGPWKFTAIWRGYRDCSRPDLSKVNSEPWILRPR